LDNFASIRAIINYSMNWFFLFITWIETHNAFVTAIATIFIAGFTWALVRATCKLWNVSKESADAAKKSADALQAIEGVHLDIKIVIDIPDSYREEIIKPGTESLPGVNEVNIIITNRGKSLTILKRITVFENQFFKGFDLYIFENKFIEIGDKREITTSFYVHGSEEHIKIYSRIFKITCTGVVQYTDVFNITYDIGFCWEYNIQFTKFFPCHDSEHNYRKQHKD
jgi:hypothetical protein